MVALGAEVVGFLRHMNSRKTQGRVGFLLSQISHAPQAVN